MARRETVRTLRLYFLFVGALGAVVNTFVLVEQPAGQGTVYSALGLSVNAIFLVLGFRLPQLIVSAPKLVERLLIGVGVAAVGSGVAQGGLYFAAIWGALVVYLLVNVRRLAAVGAQGAPVAAGDPGLSLDRPAWTIDAPRDADDLRPARFWSALDGWLFQGSFVCIECIKTDAELEALIAAFEVPAQLHLRRIAGKSVRQAHLPATAEVLRALASYVGESWHIPHVTVYRDGVILLAWYDAPSADIIVAADVAEERVAELAGRLGSAWRRLEAGAA